MTHAAKADRREQLFRWFFFGVFAVILWQLALIFSPFATGLFWGGVLTIAFYPVHAALLRRNVRSDAAATLSSILVLLCFIVPVLFFGWILVREAAFVVPAVKEWVAEVKGIGEAPGASGVPMAVRPYWDRVSVLLDPLGVDLKELFISNLDQVAGRIAALGAGAARNLFLAGFNVLILVLSMFFFFKDGAAVLKWLIGLIPMEETHKQHIVARAAATFGAVVRGLLAVAVLQGFLAALGFWAAGVRFPTLLGLATIFAAFIPFVGTALVWLPVSSYMIVKGIPNGIPLLIWCAIAVSSLDNFLKAIFIGQQAKLPVLILFFALLGGMATYGFVGILLGPMLVTCALAFVRIYREEYHLRAPGEVED